MVKAVVVDQLGGTPTVREVQLPAVGAGDVRVRIAAAGVCHSDLSLINGTLTPQFPLILGHEAAGVVVETGSGVTEVAVGTHVVLNWAAPCRTCWFCTHDQPWLCSTIEGTVTLDTGVKAGDETIHTALGMGAFAEEVVVPGTAVVAIPDDIPMDVAALMGCAVLTGVGAVQNTAKVKPGESVLVIGQGGIGLSAVLGAKLAGANPIIAVDLNEEKEKLSLQAGATHFLPSDPKIAKQIRALTEGRGVDHAFECVGNPTTIRMAWGSVRRGGQCTVVGVGSKSQEVTFNPLELFHFSRTLTSSIYGASDPDEDIPTLVQHVIDGSLDLDVLITHRVTLDDVPAAFDRMATGEGARSVIELNLA
ncbi:MAG: Zn-dependent alcohol dehydrogenase [Kineosporiaceae bacterium]|nr:Zn-dependent alcohol dehydrogenase [Aeromicrobium sp.]